MRKLLGVLGLTSVASFVLGAAALASWFGGGGPPDPSAPADERKFVSILEKVADPFPALLGVNNPLKDAERQNGGAVLLVDAASDSEMLIPPDQSVHLQCDVTDVKLHESFKVYLVVGPNANWVHYLDSLGRRFQWDITKDHYYNGHTLRMNADWLFLSTTDPLLGGWLAIYVNRKTGAWRGGDSYKPPESEGTCKREEQK
jgi:hypothetical protein